MKRRGFTLIELLVVIAIIAILAAILFPVFLSAKEKARQAMCCSNLKQLTMAFFAYADDNNGLLPISQRRRMLTFQPSSNPTEWTGSRWSAYGTAPMPCDPRTGSLFVGGYARSVGIFNCPSDQDLPCYFGINNKIAWSNAASWPPGGNPDGLPRGFGVTYSLNEDLCDKSAAPFTIKLAAATAGRTGQVLFLIHERRGANNGAISGQNDGYFQWTLGDPQGTIHTDGTTCSFADGHVKWISNPQIHIIEFPTAGVSRWHRNSFYYGVANPTTTE